MDRARADDGRFIADGLHGRVHLCAVTECTRLTRRTTYCEMHYYRLRRTGSLGPAEPVLTRYESPSCTIDGCTKPRTHGPLCSMHETRKRRRGDPLAEPIHQSDRALPTGPDHPGWLEVPTYDAVHQRLRRERGRATTHSCAECGKPAQQWALRNFTDMLMDDVRCGPYSANPEDYAPMCIPCHKAMDLARIKASNDEQENW